VIFYEKAVWMILRKLSRLYSVFIWQFGINPIRFFRAVLGLPRYLTDLFKFRRDYKGKLKVFPCLHDWYEDAGSTKEEYFWQDLYVAQKIHVNRPSKHVDIGSRIDGFVTHLASFREVEVFDIRPNPTAIPRVVFRQSDLMNPSESFVEYCDSLSCLHALEHFGLGRYGDPINPLGYVSGLRNMSAFLKPGGTFYLSVPVGIELVEFNAHRIFNPEKIISLCKDNNLILKDLAWIGQEKKLVQSTNIEFDINNLKSQPYALAIFIFSKNSNVN
jgi:hypothetical protein